MSWQKLLASGQPLLVIIYYHDKYYLQTPSYVHRRQMHALLHGHEFLSDDRLCLGCQHEIEKSLRVSGGHIFSDENQRALERIGAALDRVTRRQGAVD